MRQIPHGPEELTCPLHKRPMSMVCHKCPLWVQVRGKDPQSNEEIDRWDCSLAWLPTLLLENAQQTRQTCSTLDDFRNRMVMQNQVLSVLYKDQPGALTDERPKGGV